MLAITSNYAAHIIHLSDTMHAKQRTLNIKFKFVSLIFHYNTHWYKTSCSLRITCTRALITSKMGLL